MSEIVIGIDPDSKAHGVSIYVNGNLDKLKSMPTIELYREVDYIVSSGKAYYYQISAQIEDVKARRAAWHGGGVGGAIDVGKCHQAQTEAERVFEYFNISITKHKISKTWKSQAGKKQFQLATGWKGKSNEDTRSAAYFGYLGLDNKTT